MSSGKVVWLPRSRRPLRASSISVPLRDASDAELVKWGAESQPPRGFVIIEPCVTPSSSRTPHAWGTQASTHDRSSRRNSQRQLDEFARGAPVHKVRELTELEFKPVQ